MDVESEKLKNQAAELLQAGNKVAEYLLISVIK